MTELRASLANPPAAIASNNDMVSSNGSGPYITKSYATGIYMTNGIIGAINNQDQVDAGKYLWQTNLYLDNT